MSVVSLILYFYRFHIVNFQRESFGNLAHKNLMRHNKAKCNRCRDDSRYDWEKNSLKTTLWRRSQVSCWMKSWPWASSICVQTRRPTISLAASKDTWSIRTERELSPSTLPLWGPIWNIVSRPGAKAPERWAAFGVGPEEGQEDDQRIEACLLGRMIEETGLI